MFNYGVRNDFSMNRPFNNLDVLLAKTHKSKKEIVQRDQKVENNI